MRFPFSRRESLIPSITLHHRRYFFLLQNYFSFFNIESLLKVDFVSRISICTRLNPIQHFFIEKYEVEPRVLGELWILNKLRLFYRIPRYLRLARVSAVYNSFENCSKRRFPLASGKMISSRKPITETVLSIYSMIFRGCFNGGSL